MASSAVARVDVFAGDLDMGAGFRHSSANVQVLEEVFVKLTAADGSVGRGEVRGNAEYVTGETRGTIVSLLHATLAPLALGHEPRRTQALAAAMERAIPGNYAAKSALDVALHDLAARQAGVPLYRWLGGLGRTSWTSSVSIPFGSVEEAAEQARRYRAEGFNFVKVRIGGDAQLDEARVRVVRETVGPDLPMSVDANGALEPKEALRRLRALAGYDLRWAEQPTKAHPIEPMRQVTAAAPLAIVADESVHGPEDVLEIARRRAADLVLLKLAKTGGIVRLMRAVGIARAAGLRHGIAQMDEGRLATAAGRHCALALSPEHVELCGFIRVLDDPTTGVELDGGRIEPDERPGLGVEVDEGRLQHLFTLE